MSDPTPAPPPRPELFVCWEPSEDELPELVKALNAIEAAKLFTLKKHAEGPSHDNDWSRSQVLVVSYQNGETTWVSVKVTVEASS